MRSFVRWGAVIVLCMMAAVPVLALSENAFLIAPVWWGVSYIAYRNILGAERRALSNVLALHTGELVLFVVSALHGVGSTIWIQIAAVVSLVGWLLFRPSRMAAFAVLACDVVWIGVYAFIAARAELWSPLSRAALGQVLLGFCGAWLTIRVLLAWSRERETQLPAVFD